MRTSEASASAAVLLALAACDASPKRDQATAPGAAVSPGSTAADDRVPCARGTAPLADDCTVEQRDTRDGPLLTLRHTDGGFRRLLVTHDGRGVVAADGAQRASVTIVDADTIEVTLGADRYRLPATVKARR